MSHGLKAKEAFFFRVRKETGRYQTVLNLPSFGQNLANPFLPPQGRRHMCIPPNLDLSWPLQQQCVYFKGSLPGRTECRRRVPRCNRGKTLAYSRNYSCNFGAESNLANTFFLQAESARHGDIVQERFIDSYYNLTIKSLMAIKWTTQNCDHFTFLLKERKMRRHKWFIRIQITLLC